MKPKIHADFSEIEARMLAYYLSEMADHDPYAEFYRYCMADIPKSPVLATGYDPARHDDMVDAMVYMLGIRTPPKECWKYGWLFRLGSGWLGYHWSKRNKRLCLNLLPFVTLWITLPGGKTPAEDA